MEYSVYSDESYITAERYRSIAAVSFPRTYESEIVCRIEDILSNSSVDEFKWFKLKNAKYRFCAEKFVDLIFSFLLYRSIRIDVLTWDTEDSRHKIPGRDDDANFARMFFHLLRNLMNRRENDSEWYIYPDENMAIDWETVKDCLVSTGRWRQYFESQLFGNEFSEQYYHIREFEQIVSKDTPPSHLADFMAGLAVFSINSYDNFCCWCDKQMPLFGTIEHHDLSNKTEERCKILEGFIAKCRAKNLGVSIKSKCCLWTPNPKNPINFWHYSPQHDRDRAPTRH